MHSNGVLECSGTAKAFVLNMAYVGSKGTKLTVERQTQPVAAVAASEESVCTERAPDDCGLHGSSSELFSAWIINRQRNGNRPAHGWTHGLAQTPLCVFAGGVHKSEHSDVNALVVVGPNGSTPARPTGSGRVLSLQNVANSSYHALQTTVRHSSGPLTARHLLLVQPLDRRRFDRSDPYWWNSYESAGEQGQFQFRRTSFWRRSATYISCRSRIFRATSST